MKKNFYLPKNLEYSKKIKEIFYNKNKYDILEMIKKDISNNFKKQYNYKGYNYIETLDFTIYKFNDKILENIYSKKPLSNKDIFDNLINNNITISSNILNKFENIPLSKINEIISIFLKSGSIRKRTNELIYIENKLEEVILVFDYFNMYLENILEYNLKEIGSDSKLSLEKDKIVIKRNENMKELKEKNLLEQLLYLDSYNYNINTYKNDIIKNFAKFSIINNNENTFNIYTKKYIYTINNYNIISIKNNKGLPMPTNINKHKNKNKNNNLSNIEIDFPLCNSHYCNLNVKDFYGNFIKAQEYIEQFGISIRVLTKFITENNFFELYKFITSDIIYYGNILYDDYMEGTLIILTNRFYYIIKDNTIINILNTNGKEIKECSLLFKPITTNRNIKKTTILSLDIKDKIRDFITIQTINNLKISSHAKDRFKERVSKNDLFESKEDMLKNDIYKYGEVMLGTYFLNTKLIKGQKFVYVLNNNEIISIWKINEFIENLNNRYFKKVENF